MGLNLNTDAVRQAAQGNWQSILSSTCSVSIESLDGKHHPCPKCGGEDRFRMLDETAGALFCNQCFNKENGDGFAAIQWLIGCKFPEAVKKVAEYLGMDATKKSKKADPEKDLQFQPWSSQLVKLFLAKKPGITEEALVANGARFAKYKRVYTVIALPIIGENLNTEKPVGWVILDFQGNPLPKWNKQGEVVGQVKMKITYGSKPGFVGKHAVERIKTEGLVELVWKVEGVTDMLAAHAAIPDSLQDRHVAITNSNGANENPRWQASVLAGFNTNVIHDADEPGQAGAESWSNSIAAQQEDKSTRNVQLPYVIEPKSGKDIRDWFAEGNKYGDLMNLADQAKPIRGDKVAALLEFTNFEEQGDDLIPLHINQIISDIKYVTENWPRSVGNILFVNEGNNICWLDKQPAFFGWLQSRRQVNWRSGGSMVRRDEVFHEFARTSTNYQAIEYSPHEPPIKTHYYACKTPSVANGDTLRKLLDQFRPETTVDRDLIQAAIMTTFWGGPPGARPAFVIAADEGRGVGKTKLVEIIAYLSGGSIDVSAGEDIAVLKQRFLSPEALPKRVSIIDNVKTMRFSWSELESLITTATISGKRMYVGEANRPNTLTWFITLNGVNLATDMAQRSVIIKLVRGENIGTWYEDTIRFIDENREQLIGDIIGTLREEQFTLDSHSRWAAWERDVLSRLPEPGEAQKLILERQQLADCEQDEAGIIEDFIADQLSHFNYDPQIAQVRIPVGTIAKWYCWATNEKARTAAVTKRLKQMSAEGQMSRLSPDPSRTYGRCFIWTGTAADIHNEQISNDLQTRIEHYQQVA